MVGVDGFGVGRDLKIGKVKNYNEIGLSGIIHY